VTMLHHTVTTPHTISLKATDCFYRAMLAQSAVMRLHVVRLWRSGTVII